MGFVDWTQPAENILDNCQHIECAHMNLRQVAVFPVFGPMLSNANVREKFAANSGAASNKCNDDIGNFLEDAKIS